MGQRPVPALTGPFCVNCKHVEGGMPGGQPLGGPRCLHPGAYKGGDVDLVTGRDRREFTRAADMRRGDCGRSGKLFADAATAWLNRS